MGAKIEIYTWTYCPFCIRAKALLEQKGVEFTEYCIDGDAEARAKMTVRAQGRSSLPQIFIDDRHIGGCDDLFALDRDNALEPLLNR